MTTSSRASLPLLLLGACAATAEEAPSCAAGPVRQGRCFENNAMGVYHRFNASEAAACCGACAAAPQTCRSWMWYYSEAKGRKDSPQECFLGRSSMPTMKGPTTCDSGVSDLPVPPPPPPAPKPPQPTCTQTPKPLSGRPPHILHIVADDLGYNDMGYANPVSITPHIDGLRACGTHLDQFYTFKMCGPSRGSMLTGRYPFHFGVYSNQDINNNGIPANFTYLPEILKKAKGYATHAVGKWHNGFRTKEMTPTFRGFDTFFGYWHCCSDYWTHSLDGHIDQTNATGYMLTPDFGHQQEYSAFLYAKEASRLIGLHNSKQPLYLYLPFESVHGPIEAPEAYVSRYNATIQDTKRRTFSGMLSAMDDAVQMVVESLQVAGLWEDSLIFFNSDNGGPLGSANNLPLRGGKFTLWEGGTRITAFIGGPRYTDMKPTTLGGAWDGISHTADLLPTLCHAAGVWPLPALEGADGADTPIDGYSFWHEIIGNSSSSRTEVVHMILNRFTHRDCNASGHSLQNCGASIRVGDYKLYAGYPGDSQWGALPSDELLVTQQAAVMRSSSLGGGGGGGGGVIVGSDDSCDDVTGVGCPCWHGYCLFDVQHDRAEHHEISAANPAIVQRLLKRLMEVSKTGTQGAYMCKEASAASSRALKRELNRTGAFLPYVDSNGNESFPWMNDMNAPVCYNP